MTNDLKAKAVVAGRKHSETFTRLMYADSDMPPGEFSALKEAAFRSACESRDASAAAWPDVSHFLVSDAVIRGRIESMFPQ